MQRQTKGQPTGKPPASEAAAAAKVATQAPGSAGQVEETQKCLVSALQLLQEAQTHQGAPPAVWAAVREVRAALAAARGESPKAGPLQVDADQLAAFGQRLCERRRAAGLSQEALAKAAGLSKRTVYNLEHGVQPPTRATICALLAVRGLNLGVSDYAPQLSADPQWVPNTWLAPRYDPAALQQDLVHLLNGPGGQLEQTLLYIEPQSANDYLTLCSGAPVFVGFRNASPLEPMAQLVGRRFANADIDVIGLGSGDGRSETRVAQALAASRAPAPGLRLYLLDISHTLLSVAHKHACAQLAPLGCDCFALHANFHDLSRYPMLHAAPAPDRRRLYTLLGGTMANLDNETRFFRELAQAAARDDLVLVDIQLPFAPVESPDEIRRLDPALGQNYRAPHYQWLIGPLQRHIRNLASCSLRVELNDRCAVPGSYELTAIAQAKMSDGIERHFLMVRHKRYDPARLSGFLADLGWETLSTQPYGVTPAKTSAVLLLRRT